MRPEILTPQTARSENYDAVGLGGARRLDRTGQFAWRVSVRAGFFFV